MGQHIHTYKIQRMYTFKEIFAKKHTKISKLTLMLMSWNSEWFKV